MCVCPTTLSTVGSSRWIRTLSLALMAVNHRPSRPHAFQRLAPHTSIMGALRAAAMIGCAEGGTQWRRPMAGFRSAGRPLATSHHDSSRLLTPNGRASIPNRVVAGALDLGVPRVCKQASKLGHPDALGLYFPFRDSQGAARTSKARLQALFFVCCFPMGALPPGPPNHLVFAIIPRGFRTILAICLHGFTVATFRYSSPVPTKVETVMQRRQTENCAEAALYRQKQTIG